MTDQVQSDPTEPPCPSPHLSKDEPPRPRLQRKRPLRRTAPMARSKPLARRTGMHQKTRLSARERAAYRLAMERVRTVEGYLECEACGRSLLDGEEQRHHIRFRSQGGKTESENLAILCGSCHRMAHGIRPASTRTDRDDALDQRSGDDG
jgi:5-methylcytosine-specific restriction endonuclease McrA